MMKNFFIKPASFFLALVFILTACLKDDDFRTEDDENREIADYIIENNILTEPSWTGLYYIEETEGTGPKAVLMDTVSIEYTASLIDGTVVGSSENLGEPYTFILRNDNTISGLHEGVENMKLGGKATIIIPSKLAFGGSVNGPVKEYSTLIYELELVGLDPGIPVEEYDIQGITPENTNSGLIYYPVVKTENEKVVAGNQVQVHYTGYLDDGTIFDSSIKKGQIAEFIPGSTESSLIAGFEEGLLLMREGEKYRFYIPADLAYGNRGIFPFIPPNSELAFDIELIKIGEN
jgi:FKBP-type peptidyl-prolyl cis-trans isomerase